MAQVDQVLSFGPKFVTAAKRIRVQHLQKHARALMRRPLQAAKTAKARGQRLDHQAQAKALVPSVRATQGQ